MIMVVGEIFFLFENTYFELKFGSILYLCLRALGLRVTHKQCYPKLPIKVRRLVKILTV